LVRKIFSRRSSKPQFRNKTDPLTEKIMRSTSFGLEVLLFAESIQAGDPAPHGPNADACRRRRSRRVDASLPGPHAFRERRRQAAAMSNDCSGSQVFEWEGR
jgi:hypothetical protein